MQRSSYNATHCAPGPAGRVYVLLDYPDGFGNVIMCGHTPAWDTVQHKVSTWCLCASYTSLLLVVLLFQMLPSLLWISSRKSGSHPGFELQLRLRQDLHTLQAEATEEVRSCSATPTCANCAVRRCSRMESITLNTIDCNYSVPKGAHSCNTDSESDKFSPTCR